MADWTFLTNHARAIFFIADHPDARLRDLATALDVTERTAYGIVADLTEAGYVVKKRDGRRNRYQIRVDLPLREPIIQERTLGTLLGLLIEPKRRGRDRRPSSGRPATPAKSKAKRSRSATLTR